MNNGRRPTARIPSLLLQHSAEAQQLALTLKQRKHEEREKKKAAKDKEGLGRIREALQHLYHHWEELKQMDAGPEPFNAASFSGQGWLARIVADTSTEDKIVSIGWTARGAQENVFRLVAQTVFGTVVGNPFNLIPSLNHSRVAVQHLAVVIAIMQDLFSTEYEAVMHLTGGRMDLAHLPCTVEALPEWMVRNMDGILNILSDLQTTEEGWACFFSNLTTFLVKRGQVRGFAGSESSIDWPGILVSQLATGTRSMILNSPYRRRLIDAVLGPEAMGLRVALSSSMVRLRDPSRSIVTVSALDQESDRIGAYGFPWTRWLAGDCIISGSCLANIVAADYDEDDPVEAYLERYKDADLNVVMRKCAVRECGGSVVEAALRLINRVVEGFKADFPDVPLIFHEHANALTITTGGGFSARPLTVHRIMSDDDGSDLAMLAPSIISEGFIVPLLPPLAQSSAASEGESGVGEEDGGEAPLDPETVASMMSISVRTRDKDEKKQKREAAKKEAEVQRYRDLAQRFRGNRLGSALGVSDLARMEEMILQDRAMTQVGLKLGEKRELSRMEQEQQEARRARQQRRYQQVQYVLFTTFRLSMALENREFPVDATDRIIADRMLSRGMHCVGSPPFACTRGLPISQHETELPEKFWQSRITYEKSALAGDGPARSQPRTMAEAFVIPTPRDDWRPTPVASNRAFSSSASSSSSS